MPQKARRDELGERETACVPVRKEKVKCSEASHWPPARTLHGSYWFFIKHDLLLLYWSGLKVFAQKWSLTKTSPLGQHSALRSLSELSSLLASQHWCFTQTFSFSRKTSGCFILSYLNAYCHVNPTDARRKTTGPNEANKIDHFLFLYMGCLPLRLELGGQHWIWGR